MGQETAFCRTELLIGADALRKLAGSRAAVFGVGGVGGCVCEALARAGVGHFLLVDKDVVSVSNLNRQIIALHSTIGQSKVEVVKARILDINPEAEVEVWQAFFLPENADMVDFTAFDYVIDCVDNITAKIEIILRAQHAGTAVISAMGAGNHLDPCAFRVADIYDSSICPLARVMRRELKKRGVKALKVVYSTEAPVVHRAGDRTEKDAQEMETEKGHRPATGSISFCPPVAGFLIAAEVVKDLASGEIRAFREERFR